MMFPIITTEVSSSGISELYFAMTSPELLLTSVNVELKVTLERE